MLTRAVKPLDKHFFSISSYHDSKKKIYHFANGSKKLCRFLNIDTKFNNINLTTNKSIYLEGQLILNSNEIITTKRINIDYTGEDKNRLWRFYIKNNSFISKKW